MHPAFVSGWNTIGLDRQYPDTIEHIGTQLAWYMARTRRSSVLLPLPPRSAVRREENKAAAVLRILRSAALAARTDESRPFYPMRYVTARYGLSLSTVARLYSQLENDGLLNKLRGSGTVLRGSRRTRQMIVRDLVAIPAALTAFLSLQDYRSFVMTTRRELRRRNLLPAIIFYDQRTQGEALAEEMKEFRADVVVWYLPDSAARVAAAVLRDSGIAVVGIAEGLLPSIRCQYAISREKAAQQTFRDWASRGFVRVHIARGELRSSANEEWLESLLAQAGLDWEFVEAKGNSADEILRRLCGNADTAVVFLPRVASWYLMRAPATFHRLIETCRVALLGGPVSVPFAPAGTATVDLVVVNWRTVAQQITEDILSGVAFGTREPVIFDATAKMRVPLAQFAQRL